MKYQNFNVSIYCPVGTIDHIEDFERFDKDFDLLNRNIKIGKVYLETYRNGVRIEREQMLRVIDFFKRKGIMTSGGITTDDMNSDHLGFGTFCYTSAKSRETLKEIVTLTAELFDEIILDDFFFTNCRCESCIAAKGNRSWSKFRLDLMREISEEIIVKTAKEVNPKVKTIIKYPNWYEHYQETGYNPAEQPFIFDYIYTGTETRNPAYSQQHLPKYLGYFIMRYLENTAKNRNLGGWFDPYECSYNLTSYLEQGYLTLFAKAKEVTLFNIASLCRDPSYSVFPPAVGQAFTDVDGYLGQLGNPTGTACYIPHNSFGEDYLHNYIGMCGIPLEPSPVYPDGASRVFLSRNAAQDADIIGKIKGSLYGGADVIVTSGFVEAMGEAFHELMHVSYSRRKAVVNRYVYSVNGGLNYGGYAQSAKEIIVPQLEFYTNDVWDLISGIGEDNTYPILLGTKYANGHLFVLTIPDDCGNLYHYPREVLNGIRKIFADNPMVRLDAVSKVALFTYDNDTFILRSFNSFADQVTVTVNKENAVLSDLERDITHTGVNDGNRTIFSSAIEPGMNLVFKILQKTE